MLATVAAQLPDLAVTTAELDQLNAIRRRAASHYDLVLNAQFLRQVRKEVQPLPSPHAGTSACCPAA